MEETRSFVGYPTVTVPEGTTHIIKRPLSFRTAEAKRKSVAATRRDARAKCGKVACYGQRTVETATGFSERGAERGY